MKVGALLKIVDAGWVRKKKGYRVYFESLRGDTVTPDLLPGENEAPFASDVVAWRSAWKLSRSNAPDNTELDGAELINITVVDDGGTPVPYYATGRYTIYNKRSAQAE